MSTYDLHAAGVVFHELRDEVTDAAVEMVAGRHPADPELPFADAVLGATLAALLERGWLHVPTTERRTA